MGNSIFQEIQLQYHQKGIDYVAFRYHERKMYKQVIQKIKEIKQKAHAQQRKKLEIITMEKHSLQTDFQDTLKNTQIQHPETIIKAQLKNKQKIQDFSGFNQQCNRLDEVYIQVNRKYEVQKASIVKKIRQDVMKKQNKSKLNSIKEFDYRSDKIRRKIQNQCINKYPQKAFLKGADEILQNIKWQNYEQNFQTIFNQNQFLVQAEAARRKVINAIIPSAIIYCC